MKASKFKDTVGSLEDAVNKIRGARLDGNWKQVRDLAREAQMYTLVIENVAAIMVEDVNG